MGLPGTKLDLMALDRVTPTVVVARWRLHNTTAAEYKVDTMLKAPALDNLLDQNAASALSLVDSVNGNRHFPLSDPYAGCLCTRGAMPIAPGGTLDVVAAFPAPPAQVTTMDVVFPTAPVFLDVPLGSRPAEMLPVTATAKADVNAPTWKSRIRPLVNTVDDPVKSQDDDGKQLSVRLSSDVVFAVNKADLNDKAQAVLKEVAAKIDQSPGSTVKIDGHTDNSGTDAINQPLSQRRADSVKAALEKLVTRTGVTYQTQGHGSGKPIATNDNAAGRQTNRRVTISFDRPKPPAPATPSPGAAPAASGRPLGTAPVGAPPVAHENSWPAKGQVRIDELKRDADGYVSLVWTVRNDDPAKKMNIWTAFEDYRGTYLKSSTEGVVLSTPAARYRLVRDTDRLAVGPLMVGMPLGDYEVVKDEEYTLWGMFKVPAEVTSLTVEVPGFKPITNLPIG
ncbi:hypothetical protein GCM10009678_50760 [Actinomadura kijaniata]